MRKNIKNLSQGPAGARGATGSTGNAAFLSLGPIDNNPNPNGMSFINNVLYLEEADENYGGVLNAVAQDIGGAKLFHDDVTTLKTFRLPTTTDSTHGALYINNQPFLHSYADLSNTFVGANSCIDNSPTPSTENTGLGNDCMGNIIDPAQGNSAVGSGSMAFLQTGIGNSAVGWTSLSGCTGGSNNVAFGSSSLPNCTGSRNIGIGYLSGQSVTSNDDTINIGCIGTTGSGEINIGTTGTHSKTCIAGIVGVSPGGTPQSVIINPSTGQLGSQTITTVSTAKGSIIYSPAYNTTTTFTYSALSTYNLLNLVTTASGLNSSFTTNNLGRLTYTGSATTTFLLNCSCAVDYSGATARIIGLDARKNSSTAGLVQCYTYVAQNVTPMCMSLSGLISLATNDFVEIYTANFGVSGLTCDFQSFSLTLSGLN